MAKKIGSDPSLLQHLMVHMIGSGQSFLYHSKLLPMPNKIGSGPSLLHHLMVHRIGSGPSLQYHEKQPLWFLRVVVVHFIYIMTNSFFWLMRLVVTPLFYIILLFIGFVVVYLF